MLWNGGKGDMSSADFAKMVENKYNANPNSMGNSAAGFANRALEPYSGVTTFRGRSGRSRPRRAEICQAETVQPNRLSRTSV